MNVVVLVSFLLLSSAFVAKADEVPINEEGKKDEGFFSGLFGKFFGGGDEEAAKGAGEEANKAAGGAAGAAGNVVAFLLAILHICYGGGHKNPKIGDWIVTDPTSGNVCIRMQAQIDLNLTYILDGSEIERWGIVSVPVNSTASGSCGTEVAVEGHSISSQTLRVTFDEHKFPGWWVQFDFSKSKDVGAYKNEFILWRVSIKANYTSMGSVFQRPAEQVHVYEEQVNLEKDHEDVSALANAVYANDHYSYFCPSQQTYDIITGTENGPTASITFKDFRVQAYGNSKDWRQRETCPADEHVSDLVPVIVGGCLAGLVLITLVAYLIYRWRLPPEVLHLTNPNSHFEDMAFDHHGRKHASSTEEEEESGEESCRHGGRHSSASEASNRRVRYQNGHVNHAYN
ncbi:hypothetical protein QR680_016321 [Steinernema hermaphroditum]|uniref:CUB domain-containing protein n=1 Tax=Steinernema hermaphroditum TaxID=289476 RepID=A0AA39HD03_9BILA|nr:hypothetical protein QR680_016321 [Steinernema hermaphroditum]